MVQGRKRRLARFDARAQSFAYEFVHGGRSKTIARDGNDMAVGDKNYRGLIVKMDRNALPESKRRFGAINGYLARRKIVPGHFVLVEAKGAVKNGVHIQDYFHAPSVDMLYNYFIGKKFETKEEYWMCKRFARQFRGITKEKLEMASKELVRYALECIIYADPRNTIVLGQNRDGKLRLAIIDS